MTRDQEIGWNEAINFIYLGADLNDREKRVSTLMKPEFREEQVAAAARGHAPAIQHKMDYWVGVTDACRSFTRGDAPKYRLDDEEVRAASPQLAKLPLVLDLTKITCYDMKVKNHWQDLEEDQWGDWVKLSDVVAMIKEAGPWPKERLQEVETFETARRKENLGIGLELLPERP